MSVKLKRSGTKKATVGVALLGFLLASLTGSYANDEQPRLEQIVEPTPGLSGSFNYEDFDSVKGPLTKNLLSIINNLALPDISFPGGNLRKNKLYVQQRTDGLKFDAIEKENALSFMITNVQARLRVDEFSYTGGLVPIRGYLEINMSGILLKLKTAFKKILQNGRLLPQIDVTECRFELDTNQIKFNFGGDFLLSLADLIIPIIKGFFRGPVEKLVYEQIKNGLPNTFNNFVKNSNGYFTIGEVFADQMRDSPYRYLTLDYQLDDDFRIYKDRLEFGINGTFFNKDKGYRVPPGLKDPNMPLYDKNIPSKLQIFLSNYLLESFAYAFLEKQPFTYPMPAWRFNNRIAPFDTTTFEAVFPFLTSRFGKNIPTDLIFHIKGIHHVQAHSDDSKNPQISEGTISLMVDLNIEGKLVYPGGVNKSIGFAEMQDAIVKVKIFQKNGTIFKTKLLSGNVTTQYIDTNYLGRFKSSPYVINTALRFLLDWLNEEYVNNIQVDLQDYTFGIFKFNDTHLGYNDGYLSFGFSADFKDTNILKAALPSFIGKYLEPQGEWIEPPPVEQHLIEQMNESERLYQQYIRAQGEEFFQREQEKIKNMRAKLEMSTQDFDFLNFEGDYKIAYD